MNWEDDPAAACLEDDRRHLAAARDCVSVWHSFAVPIAVPDALRIKFRVIFPLAAHALNLVDAALAQLPRYPLVAAASTRLALEHAIAGQWVLLTEGGEHTLAKWMEHSWQTRAQQFARAAENPPELDDIVARPAIPGADRSFSAERAFARFDSTGLFYDAYRDLSQAVHPSYGTLQAHFEISPDDRARGTWPTRIDRDGVAGPISSTAMGLGVAGVFALDALARLRDGRDGLHDVERIAAEAGLPHDLTLSDQHPERQPH